MRKYPVTAVLPDFKAKGISHGNEKTAQFMKGIEALCRENDYAMCLVANGPDPESFANTMKQGVERLVSDGFAEDQVTTIGPQHYSNGVVGAVQDGFDHILAQRVASDVIAKFDTAEHPAAGVAMVIGSIQSKTADLAYGNLEFGDTAFTEGRQDKKANALLEKLCAEGGFPHLTNAHGCYAVDKEKFEEVYTTAKKIHERAGEDLQWGFDMAMIFAAHILGLRVEQHDIPAETDRRRDDDKDYEYNVRERDVIDRRIDGKVAAQVDRWEKVIAAAIEIRNEMS